MITFVYNREYDKGVTKGISWRFSFFLDINIVHTIFLRRKEAVEIYQHVFMKASGPRIGKQESIFRKKKTV